MSSKKTLKAVKRYYGGIHYLTDTAVREDGVVFNRVQEKTHVGYRWTSWKMTGEVWTAEKLANPPATVAVGFADVSSKDDHKPDGLRLPQDPINPPDYCKYEEVPASVTVKLIKAAFSEGLRHARGMGGTFDKATLTWTVPMECAASRDIFARKGPKHFGWELVA